MKRNKKFAHIHALLIVMAIMFLTAGCSGSTAPKLSKKPIITPELNAAYSEQLVLSEGAQPTLVEINTSKSGVPTLTVDEKHVLTFKNVPYDVDYTDGCTLSAYIVADGALIFAVPKSDECFFTNAAFYDGEVLKEVAFPYELDGITAYLFSGEWTSYNTFTAKSLLGGDSLSVTVDEAAFETMWGKPFAQYNKRNIFGVKKTELKNITADASEIAIDVTLGYELNWTYATATLTLTYNAAANAYEFSSVSYKCLPVAECAVYTAHES